MCIRDSLIVEFKLLCAAKYSFRKRNSYTETDICTLCRTISSATASSTSEEIDPVSADNIHANNIKRTIRALEYYELTGEPISTHNEREKERTSPYNFSYFVLTDDREKLYARIENRIDEMLSEGLVEEVRSLKTKGCHRGMVSMQGLGYKEILEYLDGECSLEEAVYTLKRDTRHFAKRQLTWFRRENEVTWLDKQQFDYDEEKILEYMIKELGEKGIYEKQQ